jgi:hypothetical protein
MPENNFVALAKCRFCGKDSGSILLDRRMKEIKPENAFDPNPCPECLERFKTHKYFIGNCGHSGFIKTEALKRMMIPEKFKEIDESKIFRMDKCFMCSGMIAEKDVKKI